MHKRPRLGTLLVGMLVGAAMLSPAWAASPPATKAFVKKHVKKVKKQLGIQIADRFTKAEADARFQQACKDGAVLAFATLSDPNSMPQDGNFYQVPGFNCAGGSIEMRDLHTPERFEVRLTGLGLTSPNPDLVATATAEVGGVDASVQAGPGPDVITVYTTDLSTAALAEFPFSVAVLHA